MLGLEKMNLKHYSHIYLQPFEYLKTINMYICIPHPHPFPQHSANKQVLIPTAPVPNPAPRSETPEATGHSSLSKGASPAAKRELVKKERRRVSCACVCVCQRVTEGRCRRVYFLPFYSQAVGSPPLLFDAQLPIRPGQ